jgi:hypothetical protein
MKFTRAILIISIALLAASSMDAQIVREEGVKPIAGVLGGAYPTETLWLVRSSGNEVVFATLDAEIYLPAAGHGDETEPHTTVEEGEGGCEDDGGGGSGEEGEGGCSGGGGPGRFCVQVLDSTGAAICQATRPAPPPGWMRDPRLACVLPPTSGQAIYGIRVSLAGPEGSCTQLSHSVPSKKPHPFVLNVSVRRIPASGVSIQQAVAISENRFGAATCAGNAPAAGWLCLDGAWLPPDSPLLWIAPTTPSAGGCQPPDPFVALGGGSCVNGGWLPPGMGNGAAPAACAGGAPGPGWVCQDGGWLPPDHPLVRR